MGKSLENTFALNFKSIYQPILEDDLNVESAKELTSLTLQSLNDKLDKDFITKYILHKTFKQFLESKESVFLIIVIEAFNKIWVSGVCNSDGELNDTSDLTKVKFMEDNNVKGVKLLFDYLKYKFIANN